MENLYINRNADRIIFKQEDENTVKMSGYNPEFIRISCDVEASKDDENAKYNITMVDPSGGPYIELGTNLKIFFRDEKDRFVTHIESGDGCITFKCK